MKIFEVKSGVFFCDTDGTAANVFFIQTSEGVIWIDSTMNIDEVKSVLDAAGLSSDDVTLLINTHADIDHIGGNSLFSCPKLAHQNTLLRMRQAGRPIEELPSETFTGESLLLNIGGFKIELIFMGGHKPDQTILWLPEEKILIASDLLFEGRYPFMIGSDVPAWTAAIKKLSDFGAEEILPGHGTRIGEKEINLQLAYMENTWKIVKEMLQADRSVEEILNDPSMPRVTHWEKEDFFERNILEIIEQLSR